MNRKRNFWFLWLGCIISSSCYTMLLPFLPLYLLKLGAEAETISIWSGFVFSATFFVSAFMSPYWGRMADKSGKRIMLLRAGFSLAAVYLLGAFVTSPLQLFFTRVLQGFATGFVPAALSIIASTAPKEELGVSLGLMQMASLIGTIIGPLFGGVLSNLFGIRSSFVSASIIMFIGTVILKIIVSEPEQTEFMQTGGIMNDYKEAYNNRVLMEMLLLLFAAQMGMMALQPLITLYVAQLQGHLEGADLTSGFVFGLTGIAGAVAAPLWGKSGQKLGFICILVVSFLGAGIFNSIILFSEDILGFSILQFVFGIFIAGIQPAVNTIVVMNTKPSFRGRVFGLTMSANQLGSMIGPILGGIIAVWIGIKLTFVYTGLFLTCIGLLVWKRHLYTDNKQNAVLWKNNNI